MRDNNTDVNTDVISLKDILLTVKDYWSYLLSKYKLIVIIGLFGSCIGLGYSLIKKPIYTATLTFALEDDKSSGLGGTLGLAGQFGLNIGGSGGGGIFEGSNIIELFKSRTMIKKTFLTPVDTTGTTISLAEMFIKDHGWRKGWEERDQKGLRNLQFLPGSDINKLTREHDSILEVMYGSISTSGLSVDQKDKKTGILTVEVKSQSEIFAKTFTEALVNQVSKFYIRTKSKKAQINMTILQRQLDSIRGELNGSISGVAVANDRTFGLNPALNVRRVPSIRKTVDVQANTAILTELVKQTELAKVTLRKETPLIQVVDQPTYPLKKERLGKAKAIIIGGLLAGFIIVFFLVMKRLIKSQLA